MKRFLLVAVFICVYHVAFSQFNASLTGTPVVTTGWTYGGNAYVNGSKFTLTNPIGDESGYIYYSTAENLTACAVFTVDFDFQIIPAANSTVADGIAFYYLSNPPSSFVNGGGLGLPGNPNDPNGLVLVLDTYDNGGMDPVPIADLFYDPGTFVYTQQPQGNIGTYVSGQTFIDDGNFHHCEITYNNGTLNVYFNNSTTASISGFHAITLTGYFGFSSSTGGSWSTQSIQNVLISASPLAAPPVVVSPVTYCQYAPSTQLTAVGTDLTWYTSLGGAALASAPTPNTFTPDTTWYYVTQSIGTCPGVADSIEVIVYPQPDTPVITGDTAYCQFETYIPVTAAGQNILWYTSLTGGTGSPTTPVVNTGAPGTYVYYASQTINGCEGPRGSITVTVHPGPAVNFRNTYVVPSNCMNCDGSITLYSLIPGQSDTIFYQYNGVVQPPIIDTPGADSTYLFHDLCPGIYSNIIAKVGNCTTPPLNDTIMVPPLIVDSMSFSNPTYCGACNGTIYLHGLLPGTDTVTYSYFDPVTSATVTGTQGGFLVGPDSSIVLVNLCAGFYSNIVVKSGLCVSSDYGTIEIDNPPLIIGNVQTTNPDGCNVCDGVIQLSSVPENQYDTVKYQYNGVWLNPPVVFPTNPNHTITLVNLCAGAYDSIIVSNKFGCVSNVLSDSLSGPVIQASFAYMVHPGCGGQDTVYFTNTSNPINDYTRWHFGDGTTDTVANPVHSYATGNTYNVTLYTSNLPCIDSITIPITLSHPLSAMFTSIPGDTLCQGQQITFTNTSAGGITSWLWNLGDGTIDSTDMNPPVHVYNNTGVYQVSLVVKDTIPCYDTAKATVYVDSNSAVSFKLSDSSICAGQQVIFTATYTRIGSEGINWNFGDGFTAGDTNPVSHTYANNMDSAVVMLSAAYRACPDTTSKHTVYIHPYPIVNLGGDTSLCPGGTPIALSDNINISTPGTKWVWNTGDTTAGIVVKEPGVYYVTVTEDGCSNTDSVWVKKDCYIDIPNVFTPNNDGLNDYFFPTNLLTSGVTEFKMEIYNRWGQQIFETGNTDGQGWDGKFNGTDQPEGVYVYIIDVSFKNGTKEHHQGNVTLLR